MSGFRFMLVITLFLGAMSACRDEQADCAAYLGTYSGTLSGTSPLNGTLTLVVADDRGLGKAGGTGTWSVSKQ